MTFSELPKKYKNQIIKWYRDWDCINEAKKNWTKKEIIEIIEDNNHDYHIVLNKWGEEVVIIKNEYYEDEDGDYIEIVKE